MNAVGALNFPSRRVAWLPAAGAGLPPGLGWRDARDDDLPFLHRLYADVRAAELAAVPWPEAARQAFLDSQFALQHRHYTTHYPSADYLLVEAAGQAVGRLYLHRGEHEVDVVDIALLAAARGHGIGTVLLRLVQRTALRGGLGSVMLHVEQRNGAARRLYERLGFVVEADSGSHLRMRWIAATLS